MAPAPRGDTKVGLIGSCLAALQKVAFDVCCTRLSSAAAMDSAQRVHVNFVTLTIYLQVGYICMGLG